RWHRTQDVARRPWPLASASRPAPPPSPPPPRWPGRHAPPYRGCRRRPGDDRGRACTRPSGEAPADRAAGRLRRSTPGSGSWLGVRVGDAVAAAQQLLVCRPYLLGAEERLEGAVAAVMRAPKLVEVVAPSRLLALDQAAHRDHIERGLPGGFNRLHGRGGGGAHVVNDGHLHAGAD